MPKRIPPRLNDYLADQLTDARDDLSGEWIERVGQRLA
jgi:hypothetical protein